VRAVVQHDAASREVLIWLIDDAERLYYPPIGEEKAQRVEVQPGRLLTIHAPSLRLPRDGFEQLIAEGANVLPPDRAQGRHLDDAIKVRDQLLGLLVPSA
jgi:hypothetical protein